jgi:hypothetical protein
MSGAAQTTHANDASAKPMPGLSRRAQAFLAPRQHPQFTRAVPDASLCWPGTHIVKSMDNGFTRPAGPSVAARVRTDRELAADEAKRYTAISSDKPDRTPAQKKSDERRRQTQLANRRAAQSAI